MIYQYQCPSDKCDQAKIHEIYKPMAEHDREEKCPSCGAVLLRIYGTFQRLSEFQPYYDEVDRSVVTSRRQEKEIMKKHGMIPAQDMFHEKFEAQCKHARWKARHPHSVMMGKAA